MAEQLNYSDTLYAARSVANRAIQAGVLSSYVSPRPIYYHIGAVLADSVLQTGLNYVKVVKPRIEAILRRFPHAATIDVLIEVIESSGSSIFLQWQHDEKISRFNCLVAFLVQAEIENTRDLGGALQDNGFRADIQRVKGIGPKTVDYMACLVGVDCIAVDRHIRAFAECAGLEDRSYEYLRAVFSYAADLLSVSRRQFDASIWYYQSELINKQLHLKYIE